MKCIIAGILAFSFLYLVVKNNPNKFIIKDNFGNIGEN